MDEGKCYLIMSLPRSQRSDTAVWWGPNNSGYTIFLEKAGRYTQEEVNNSPYYYDNGDMTRAVPEHVAMGLAKRVVTADLTLIDAEISQLTSPVARGGS
jgi:hypothetical protein